MFAPCQKVIIGLGDNLPSLIGILQDIEVGSGAPEPLPEKALAAIHWNVFVLWLRGKEDEGKLFEQRVQLRSPSGKILIEIVAEFRMEKPMHRFTGTVHGFPISESGEHLLKLYLHEARRESEWQEVAEFPVIVKSPVRAST